MSFELCYPFPEQWGPEYAKGMVLFRFLIYYAVPLILIGIFYIMIAIHLVFTSRVPGEIQGAMRQVWHSVFICYMGVWLVADITALIWKLYCDRSVQSANQQVIKFYNLKSRMENISDSKKLFTILINIQQIIIIVYKEHSRGRFFTFVN